MELKLYQIDYILFNKMQLEFLLLVEVLFFLMGGGDVTITFLAHLEGAFLKN